MASFGSYADLAEQHLYKIEGEKRELQWGHAWAVLALAAAVHEFAEAQQQAADSTPRPRR
jgi:hypothetical protein